MDNLILKAVLPSTTILLKERYHGRKIIDFIV